jgi:hypothetical protein
MLYDSVAVRSIKAEVQKVRRSGRGRHAAAEALLRRTIIPIDLSPNELYSSLVRLTNLMIAGRVWDYQNPYDFIGAKSILEVHNEHIPTSALDRNGFLGSFLADYIMDIYSQACHFSDGDILIKRVSFQCLKVEFWLEDPYSKWVSSKMDAYPSNLDVLTREKEETLRIRESIIEQR